MVQPAPKPPVAKVNPPKPAPVKVDKHRRRRRRSRRPSPRPSRRSIQPKPGKPDSKPDVEGAYQQGLQQFARGDTQGALASLRTSLAGNPNYPPTWRGLGLVFEKMGERDQARAAYRRYLQLAPSAGDAEQIRGRMERLGS